MQYSWHLREYASVGDSEVAYTAPTYCVWLLKYIRIQKYAWICICVSIYRWHQCIIWYLLHIVHGGLGPRSHVYTCNSRSDNVHLPCCKNTIRYGGEVVPCYELLVHRLHCLHCLHCLHSTLAIVTVTMLNLHAATKVLMALLKIQIQQQYLVLPQK